MYDILKKIQSKGYWFWNQICLWNVSSASWPWGSHGHFEWLAFYTNQRFFYFKINFLFEFVPSASGLRIISRVRHILYGDSPLIQNKGYWFWNQISLWNSLGRESRKRKKRVVKVKRKSYLKRKWKKLERRTSL